MNRLLAPSLNPAGLSSAVAAVYAVALMISHVINHQAAFSLPVTIAAVSAVLSFLTRQVVTPVADPVDGAGRQLVPAPAPAPAAAEPVKTQP